MNGVTSLDTVLLYPGAAILFIWGGWRTSASPATW